MAFSRNQETRSALIPALLIVAMTGCLKKAIDSSRSGESRASPKLGEDLQATPSTGGKPIVIVSPPSAPTAAPSEAPASDGKPIIETTGASKPMTEFIIGGNGPGSCGLPASPSNNCREGRSAIACPQGFRQVAAIGDCYVTPGFGPQCYGNRPVCAKTGADVRPVVNFHLFEGSHCPAGWEPATVPGQPQGHRIGISTGPNTDPNAYREIVWCKQTKDAGALVQNEKVLKNVGILGIDQHAAAPACPAGYVDAGGIPDCTNKARNPNFQWCVGLVRVCKAFDYP